MAQLVKTTKWVKIEVMCSECWLSLMRFPYGGKDAKRIENFFCNKACKGIWQLNQKPWTKEWLYQKYWVEKLSCPEIGKIVGRDSGGVRDWLVGFGIPTRPRGGHTSPGAFKKGAPNLFQGCKHTEKTKQRLREIALADGRVPFDPAVGSYMKGRKGAETTNWKGGVTPERQSFYSTSEWKEAVKAVWHRADARCERCSVHHNTTERRGTFHIHHIISFAVRELRAVPTNLILLCYDCHKFVHSKRNTNHELIQEIAA